MLRTQADFISQLRKDLKNDKYDFKNTEKGIHAFRRHIRQISIRFGAVGGLVTLAEPHQLPELWDMGDLAAKLGITRGPYASLPRPGIGDYSCSIPPELYWDVSRVIAELGIVKDAALFRDKYKAELKEAEVSKEVRKRLLRELQASVPGLPELYATYFPDSKHPADKKLSKLARKIAHSANFTLKMLAEYLYRCADRI